MQQKFLIFITLIFLVILLVGLNAATFVQKEEVPDSELNPNRSTYNTGATGTRALYDLLAETGRRPTRWQEPISQLSLNSKNSFSTFVIIGQVRREFTEKEIEQLLQWVSLGGKLVVIDREPPEELIKTTANWRVSVSEGKQPFFNIDASDQIQMTKNAPVAKPILPTVYTQNINAVQPSQFVSGVLFNRFSTNNTLPMAEKSETFDQAIAGDKVETIALSAPVVHLSSNEKNILVDFPFGSGEIVFLSDPYIVSNGGINLVDNAGLAVNILASREGVIAFDEYHQGFGANNNRFLEYFSGTPIAAIFIQFAFLTTLIFFGQSQRFARALPMSEPDRLSKLEYVSAMAQLQQRTRAFDLAIENIYTDFRRRVSRLLGAVSNRELAKLIVERIGGNEREIENLIIKCEEIICGEPADKKEILQITRRLREVEEKLGLQRRNKNGRK